MMSFLDKIASLTPATRLVVCDRQTERPLYNHNADTFVDGSYLCRRCGLALFRANSQFSAGCGWPSFDAAIPSAVDEHADPDGQRMEIRCHRCEAHLGHVFTGEQFTTKNRRYCVNACSLDFVAHSTVQNTEELILAGGCFWGVDYYLRRIPGVLHVEVGYTGGILDNPRYTDICQGDTGHYEAVRVLFDTAQTNARIILKRFFEIHDPTQQNGQGPDIGTQYQSAVFYYNQQQRTLFNALVAELHTQGYSVVTKAHPAQVFWKAEDAHQNYYAKQQSTPYCHQPITRFQSGK